jgi:hypothetical protein
MSNVFSSSSGGYSNYRDVRTSTQRPGFINFFYKTPMLSLPGLEVGVEVNTWWNFAGILLEFWWIGNGISI